MDRRRENGSEITTCRTFSIGELSSEMAAYKPIVQTMVEEFYSAMKDEDEEKAEIAAFFVFQFFADLRYIYADVEFEERTKGFGPGEGFPEGLVYYAWGLDGEKILLNSFDYVDFILDWGADLLSDERTIPSQWAKKLIPNIEREVTKPMSERIFDVFSILFYYQSRYPVAPKDRFWLETKFHGFILASLFWDLVDLHGDTAKYLQPQIDIPKEIYHRHRYLWRNP